MSLIEQAARRLEELRRAGVATSGQARPRVPFPVRTGAGSTSEAPQVLRGSVPLAGVLSATVRRSRQVEIDIAKLASKGYLVPGQQRSAFAEQFRAIKRPLLKNAASRDSTVQRPNLIQVSSALPGEGKTFCAINLAISIAMEVDHSVLLVDGDVIQPSVLRCLGLAEDVGLLDVLRGPGMDLSKVMLRTNLPKLTLLPAGTASSDSTELLASAAMERLLDDLATNYSDRIVIFDSPPLLPTTESRVLASRMGQVLVVVESNSTRQADVMQAFSALESCPTVMSILNKHRTPLPNAYAGYGFGGTQA